MFQFLKDAIETVKADWHDWQPHVCRNCGHVTRNFKVTFVRHRVAGTVPVCNTCYEALYPKGE